MQFSPQQPPSDPLCRGLRSIILFTNTERRYMKSAFASFFAALAFCCSAHAATGDPIELQTRFGYYHATYLIHEDGTAVEAHEWSKTVLKETALERAKSASVSY